MNQVIYCNTYQIILRGVLFMRNEQIATSLRRAATLTTVFDKDDILALKLAAAVAQSKPDENISLKKCDSDCYRINSGSCKYLHSRIVDVDKTAEEEMNGSLEQCPDYSSEDK